VQEPLKILKQYWGFDSFRHPQKEIIDTILGNRDALSLLPTGGGKSLCFQVPALCQQGLCLVVSPLIALMKDQVDQLQQKGINAKAIYTGLTHREIDVILDNCIYGQVKLLYVSPERLQTELFIERVKKMQVNLLAVDEAHCISQWGYDFRPSYLEISRFRNENLPKVTTLALTATATELVVQDIIEKLELRNSALFRVSFARSNLALAVRKVEDKETKLLEILNKVPGTACVYVRNRRRTKTLSNLLQRHGISADYYHAGLTHALRMKKQELWQQGKTRVIVATNAFGMGIDKSDVRLVIHFDLPDNLEEYYQEAGRAGRDGKKAYAVVLFHEGDIKNLERFYEQSNPSISYLKRVYQALANYFKIAVGSNKLSFFDFDIGDFCERFDFHQSEAYHAIRKLEEEGLIQLTESFYHPSKVCFNIDKTELYRFQIANEPLDPLIKMILRLYGGEVFSNFVSIREDHLAKLLGTSAIKVEAQIKHLNDLKLLTYDRIRDKPQLSFVTPRYDATRLPLNQKRILERAKIKRTKLDVMLGYAENKEQCRTNMILKYFDEAVFDECGTCDVCLSKKRATTRSLKDDMRQVLEYELRKGPKLPEELTRLFDENELALVEAAIRDMNDRGFLKYDAVGKLVWIAKTLPSN
jgi:ATP-dependent DNA helicase RecQ